MFETLIEALKAHDKIEAIMLGGSRGTGTHDEDSDYDVYVYVTHPISEVERRQMISPYVKYMEYSNRFWELEDDGILKSNIDVEFIYRNLSDLDDMLEETVIKGQAQTGYSTCFWDNLVHGQCLFDRHGRLRDLMDKYTIEYPELLKRNIIEKNAKLLKDYMPSFFYQLEKAVKRNDLVSINHRMTELMASYFDILFALNGKLHPGEKRLIEACHQLKIKPVNFEHRLNDCLRLMFGNPLEFLQSVSILIDNLYDLLKKSGYPVTSESYLKG